MEFVSLETLKEADYLLVLCDINIQLFDKWTHIGGISTVPFSKVDWYWINSGNKVNYSLKFATGEPNNGNGGSSEMCLSINKGPGSANFAFNDITCYNMHQYAFICQTKSFVY